MPALLTRVACLLCATLALAALPASALANDAPFTPRFAQTARGDIAAVGNTLMTCPAGATNCANAQNGAAFNDNDFTMTAVDLDGDASTVNSSRATVSLTAGASVLWAGLYWSADSSNANHNKIKLKVPGASSYQTVTSSELLTSTPQPSRYRAFADVTAQVAAAGGGQYWAGDVQATTGADRFAGWALLVAYRDDAQPIRRLNVYDGLGTVDGTHSFSTTIAPFHTPATGAVTTKAGLLSFEGDASLATETATFNGHALTDALNPTNNAMNSTIESGGVNFADKLPNYANQLGMDLDVFTNNPGALANDQSSATLAFSSTNEYFMPSAFFLVSDEGPATSTGAGPTIAAPSGGVAHAGQTLSADPGTWNGTGRLAYRYQWQQCDASGANCHDIAGATNSTFTPTASLVGSTVRVVVTATNDAGTSAPVVSAPIAVKASAPPVNTARPILSGPAAQGQPLTAGTGSWGGPAASYDYQWQRCDGGGQNCVDIGGANGATYTPGAQDVGHTLRAVITATNDAGSATTTTTTSAVVAANDLGSVPGSLVGATSCQQLVGGAKYRRVALAGIGTVRVRAYTNGPARKSSPVRLTTEVTGGRAKSVRYTVDGRSVAARGGALHPAKLTPAQLGKVGAHTLRTAVRGRHGAARTVVLELTTVPCQTLFTAQRWRTTAGAGLRLRIDSRTALTGLTFKVPAALLPKQGAAKRTAGFLRLSLAGRRKPVRFNLSLPKRGEKAVLLRAPGRPTVTRTGRRLVVAGLPAGTAVTELTLYRITKLDAATPRRTYGIGAVVARSGAATQTFSARPAPPR
jgi:hypothetical protein